MAVWSRQDMRDFVRTHVDVDSTELPDSLLDRFIGDGDRRVDAFSRRWQFREVEYTFSTVASQQSYDLYTTSGITTPLMDIVDVRADSYSLLPRNHRQERARWRASSPQKAKPRYFSRWGHALYLWPTPNAIYSLTIAGYRQKTDWLAANATPDYPEELHELIAWWALNRTYLFLDDEQMAQFFRDEFHDSLKERAPLYTEGLDAQPLIINGGRTPDDYRAANGLAPLAFDWE